MVAAVLALMLSAAVISVLPGPGRASAAPGDGTPSDSTMTKSGDPAGPFANLAVTVSQTTNLINQVVTVSWKGGAPTVPTSGGFNINYLQIMQCWGDNPAGPDREQCQYGGGAAPNTAAGAWVRSRQIKYEGVLVDPKETLTTTSAFVPFWPAGKPEPTGAADGDQNDFFDSQVTNEDPLVRTRADGTGVEFFEIETVRQAAGLGCGDPVTVGGGTKGRSCWLVVVPRGATEVDGSIRAGTNNDEQVSSPLSQSNWDHRIVFPLEFQPVGQTCPVGGTERRLIGNELVTDAVASWQPVLCTSGGAVYNYTQLGDDVVRNQLLGGSSPGLALATNPIPPDQAPAGSPLVYAPVGLSGLTIAFNIERQPPGNATEENLKLDGQRFTSMKLTPRLVAKLLTQSYQGSLIVRPAYLKNNPVGLTVDPEFLKLNPDYTGFAAGTKPPDALVQLGSADVTSLLWTWVKADPEASAFLAGKPDDFSGMVVNPNNINLPLPVSTFPRNDESCGSFYLSFALPSAQLCTQDAHPFTADMHDAGRSASRGDTQARELVAASDNKTAIPKKVDRQNPGQRALLAVVDTATAARYGLPTAALRNAAGNFVTPTIASLQASEAAMKPSAVGGVLASDPGATDPAAYPLTALTYAMASPSTLDTAAGKDYAAFLRYAAGPGQRPGLEPGQLPLGMVPLPDALKAQTIAVAATIEAQAGKPVPGPPGQLPASAGGVAHGSASSPDSVAAGAGATATSPAGGPGASSPVALAPGAGVPGASVPNVVQKPVAGVRRTPALPAPAVGALLLTILICGALAATSSPVLQSPVIHRLGAAVRRVLRRGVTPTDQ
ncbi:MAG: hypothetical protein DLM60_12160 [Pseudonocardiales bacterium]|nr:MAG: hypothetical protein DLM60_12160 [Pseudonocardiales bacterium]